VKFEVFCLVDLSHTPSSQQTDDAVSAG